MIADPEKAFVDLAYLRLRQNKKMPGRFDKKKINPAKASNYAGLFNNEKLAGVIKTSLR